MVLLQAMAYGKPVIITRTRTTEEYVRHGETAYLIRRGDEADLREAVKYLLGDDEQAQHIGQNAARYYAERHSMRAHVRGIVKCLSRAFGNAVIPDDPQPDL